MIADGDLVTIFDSTDLSFAIQCSRILKLQVFLNKKCETDSNISRTEVAKLKQQIKTIRDHVNKLLDYVDEVKTSKPVSHRQGKCPIYHLMINILLIQLSILECGDFALESNAPNSTVNKVNSSEFDPLQEKHQKNGTEDQKPPSKPSTPQVGN